MKKLFALFVVIVIFCYTAHTQVSTGKYTFDVSFDPAAIFDDDAGFMFQMPLIKARYFASSKLAFRCHLGMMFDNEKQYLDADGDDYTKINEVGITIAPGIEKHFGSEKIFVYVGAELPISAYSEKRETRIADNTTTTKNPFGNDYISIGINGIIGVDYYVFNNLYLGIEFSPGFEYAKYKDMKVDGDVTNKGGSDFIFSTVSVSEIRLGVRF